MRIVASISHLSTLRSGNRRRMAAKGASKLVISPQMIKSRSARREQQAARRERAHTAESAERDQSSMEALAEPSPQAAAEASQAAAAAAAPGRKRSQPSGSTAGKWSGSPQAVKEELRELYAMVGLLAKATLAHTKDLQVLKQSWGQFASIFPQEHELPQKNAKC